MCIRDSQQIFLAAKREGAVVMTKDHHFVVLLNRYGPPPKIVWVRCGNTSNVRLEEILGSTLPKALQLLEAGERLVEINAI